MLSFASNRCTEQYNGRPKPEHDTFRPAMPHINLGDVRSLERLAWAVYDGMYVLGSWPALSGLCDWACILDKTMTHIFHGRTLWEHCPQAPLKAPTQPLPPAWKGASSEAIQKKEPAEETPSTMGTSIPCLQDINTLVSCNLPSGATLAHAGVGVMAASLDLGEEDEEEPFHEFNWHRMQQCGQENHLNPHEGSSHAHRKA